MGVLCLFHVLVCSAYCPFSFCDHIDGEERAACFTLTVFLVSCVCYSSATLHRGAKPRAVNNKRSQSLKVKIENYVIIAILTSETMGKLINRIPCSHLLISSLPGSALRMLVESLGKPREVNKRSQSRAW